MTTRAHASAYTLALTLPKGQIARVLTVYSDRPHSLLMSKAEAEAWACEITGQYLAAGAYQGQGSIVYRDAPHHGCLRIVECRLEALPLHTDMGRVLAICERI